MSGYWENLYNERTNMYDELVEECGKERDRAEAYKQQAQEWRVTSNRFENGLETSSALIRDLERTCAEKDERIKELEQSIKNQIASRVSLVMETTRAHEVTNEKLLVAVEALNKIQLKCDELCEALAKIEGWV